MLIINSRLSLNLASHTLEQVLSRRRKMLLDMTAGIELEMRDALGEGMVKFGIAVLKKALLYGPLSKDVEWFNDDENFALVMQQVLYLQHGIVSECSRLAADSPDLNLKGWTMTGPSRILLLAGWVYYRASNKSTGGDAAMSIDLREANLTQSEAEQLAELLAKQERLTSVDVRSNESMGMAGAEALAKFLESGKSDSVLHVPRSLCGVTPSNSNVSVPKSMQPVDLRIICMSSAQTSSLKASPLEWVIKRTRPSYSTGAVLLLHLSGNRFFGRSRRTRWPLLTSCSSLASTSTSSNPTRRRRLSSEHCIGRLSRDTRTWLSFSSKRASKRRREISITTRR